MKDPIFKMQENIDNKTSIIDNSSLLELNSTARAQPKIESAPQLDHSQSNANDENQIEINPHVEVVQDVKIPEEAKFSNISGSFVKGIYGLGDKFAGVFARLSDECKYQAQQSIKEEK
mmetsp:Transcript_12700/g.12817  ORF Transcript_12700/g.12817 Transcript_12700/m.12817 type:complete len:118 (+) Transcript_12700:80-433(+)